MKPAKRGKQRAEGEALFPSPHSTKWLRMRLKIAGVSALFPLHHFPFHYQPRHAHDCFTTQLRWYCAIIPMDEFRNINALISQLGTSCSFDSPGLVRNEPTPGEHPQGDSTPSVLSFFYEGMVITRRFMVGNVEKAQHLRRCSPQTIR